MRQRDRSVIVVAGAFLAAAGCLVGTARANLVARWTFNEESGTALDSVTNNAADGALINGPQRVSEGGRRFMRFEQASHQYVDAGDAAKLRLTTNLTVMAWLRTTNSLLHAHEPGVGKLYRYGFSTYTYSQFYCYAGAGGNNVSGSAADGPWRQIVTTYDNAVLSLYIDGVLSGTNHLAGTIGDNTGVPFYIARNGSYPSGDDSAHFQGDYDEVRVHDEALTAAEIYTSYNNGAEPTPVSHLGAWSFDTGFGDDSAHGHDLTAYGGVTRVPGKVGYAAQFDGVDGYLSVASGAFQQPRTRYSAGAWIKAAGSGSDLGVIGDGQEEMGHDITVHGGHTIYGYHHDGGTYLTAGFVASQDPDGWVHVAHTFDGVTHRLYINGSPAGSADHGFTDTGGGSSTIQIGKVRGSASGFWNGLIDEAFFSTEVLSAAEIQGLMNGVAPPKVPSGTVVLVN